MDIGLHHSVGFAVRFNATSVEEAACGAPVFGHRALQNLVTRCRKSGHIGRLGNYPLPLTVSHIRFAEWDRYGNRGPQDRSHLRRNKG